MTITNDYANRQAGRKRVQRLKKLIVAVWAAAVVIPVVVCIILGVRLYAANCEMKKLRELNERLTSLEQEESRAQGAYSVSKIRETAGNGRAVEVSGAVAGVGAPDESVETEGMRNVYLTFDDGPSEHTGEILDILKAYEVKATFFVVGKPEERYEKEYRRIVEEGHTLGMHSYSHKYDEIYASLDNYKDDLSRLQEFLYEMTGVWSRYCRLPGGSSNTVSRVDMHEVIEYLEGQDITYFDWNVESGDTTSGKISAKRLVENCMDKIGSLRNAVVLMHDAADKDSTVLALPELIERIKELDDTQILPITDDTVPIHHQLNENE